MTDDATIYEITSILGAVLAKVGPVVLGEPDFDFGDEEQDIVLAPNEDGTITVALGTHEEA